MARKGQLESVKVKELDAMMNQILDSLVAVQSQIDECKRLETKTGHTFVIEPNTSFRYGRERLDAAVTGFNKSMRENEETNLQCEVDWAMESFVDLQTAADELKKTSKRGKISVYCQSGVAEACERFAGFARGLEASLSRQVRSLAE